MDEKFRLNELLMVTNALWIALFRRGWEDPGWGRSPAGQIAVASAIHEAAKQIKDPEAQRQIQSIAAKTIAQAAGQLENGSSD